MCKDIEMGKFVCLATEGVSYEEHSKKRSRLTLDNKSLLVCISPCRRWIALEMFSVTKSKSNFNAIIPYHPP